MIELSDFPKVHCPFVRETQKLKNGKEEYLAINEVNPGYEWVFIDEDTIAVEKLHGTNVKLKTENHRLVAMQNRKNMIDPLQILKGKAFLVEGVFMSIQKGYVENNKEQAGELLGPKVNGNLYELDTHLWYPFEKAIKDLRYKSFHEHERTYENFSSWFKEHLKSLLHVKRVGYENACFAEGVVFYNLRRRAEGKSYMAKLRRDMFDWYYE